MASIGGSGSGSPALCGSEYYVNQVLCESINQLQDLLDRADVIRDLAESAFGELKDAATAAIPSISYSGPSFQASANYSAPTSPGTALPDLSSDAPAVPALPSVPTAPSSITVDAYSGVGAAPTIPDYTGVTAPTIPPYVEGSAPVIPEHTVGTWGGNDEIPALAISTHTVDAAYSDLDDADDGLITAAVHESMFDDNETRQARIGVGEERAASDFWSANAVTAYNPGNAAQLRAAERRTNDRISESALAETIKRGEWLREDAKVLHELHIKNFDVKETLDLGAYKAYVDALIGAYGVQYGHWYDWYGTYEDARVRAYEVQWGSRIDAYVAEENSRSKGYSVQHGSEIDAYTAQENAQIEAYKAQHGNEVSVFAAEEQAKSAAYGAEWRAKADVYGVDANIYGTDGSVFSAQSSSTINLYNAEGQIVIGLTNAENERHNVLRNVFASEIDSETAKLGWSKAETDTLLQVADKEFQETVRVAELTVNNLIEAASRISELRTMLAQGLYSAANYNLTGYASQTVTGSYTTT